MGKDVYMVSRLLRPSTLMQRSRRVDVRSKGGRFESYLTGISERPIIVSTIWLPTTQRALSGKLLGQLPRLQWAS